MDPAAYPGSWAMLICYAFRHLNITPPPPDFPASFNNMNVPNLSLYGKSSKDNSMTPTLNLSFMGTHLRSEKDLKNQKVSQFKSVT